MMLPAESHPKWAAVIIGELKPEFKYLATKMLLRNLRHVYKAYPTRERMSECIIKLRFFFEENSSNKKVLSDLRSIIKA